MSEPESISAVSLPYAKQLRSTAHWAALAALVIVLFLFEPTAWPWFPPCPLYALTGWHCPGCGATRAVHALLHGDLAGALSMNALLIGIVPLIAGCWLWDFRRSRASLGSWATRLPEWSIWVGVVVLLAFGIARNLPHYPFNLLAPH